MFASCVFQLVHASYLCICEINGHDRPQPREGGLETEAGVVQLIHERERLIERVVEGLHVHFLKQDTLSPWENEGFWRGRRARLLNIPIK